MKIAKRQRFAHPDAQAFRRNCGFRVNVSVRAYGDGRGRSGELGVSVHGLSFSQLGILRAISELHQKQMTSVICDGKKMNTDP